MSTNVTNLPKRVRSDVEQLEPPISLSRFAAAKCANRCDVAEYARANTSRLRSEKYIKHP